MQKPPELSQTREQITALDKSLLALLSQRRQLSLNVARSKEVDVRPIRDTQREKELLERLVQQGRDQGLDAHFVISLYQSIIEDSVLFQQTYLHGRANPDTQKQQYTVAYLGARGSYSYLAASRYCSRRQVEMLDFGCKSFDEIVNAVESGHADYGFLPIENTSSGSINEVYDVLQHTTLSIVGETTIEVSHCLLTKPNSKLSDIKTIYAHPQPISQCSRYLSQHPHIKLEYCSSSAEAMTKVVEADNNTVAAIGSAEGGALYQLIAMEQGLANQKINQSRFIVVARKASAVPSQLPAKTTLIMATGQKPGALVEALLVLKAHNLNMSKLESRPIPGTPWEEMFYLDIDGNLATTEVQQAIKELERLTRFIKVLGCYPCETVKPTQLSQAQLLIEPGSSKQEPIMTVPHSQAKHSRDYKSQDTQLFCQHLQIGAGQFSALQQINLPIDNTELATQAKHIKESGFQAIVLNDLKQQLNEQQLKQHAQVIEQAGLLCVMQIDQEQEFIIASQLADMLILSGKQMYNPDMLTLIGSVNLPVILERNTMASIDDWLQAADTVLSHGNQQLGLCESGVRSFTHPEQLSLDLAGLVEVKSRSHLPVIVNTSFSINAALLNTHANAVKQLNADGIILLHQDGVSQAEIIHGLYQAK
ncbi:prephenate dehydratase [Shewanella frigidimarina]|uniref:prephenate dehydratase n=1 Tax=Shewanella frigidimarina TaxID=56812 RepID=UPI000F4E7801|nr:prephenate dehydratase [Shewanella frigidimarina]RPA38408.1 prephenate dehydratase [Shewanella frigidimarina]